MTIRERLARSKRRGLGAAFACWLAFAVFGIAGIAGSAMTALAIIPFLGFMGCILYMLFALRCPNCNGNMGYVIQWPSSFGVSVKLKFCPFCGIELDTDEETLRSAPPPAPAQ